MLEPEHLMSALKSWPISLTNLWNRIFLISRSIVFWYCQISRRATVPGLYLWDFFTPSNWHGSSSAAAFVLNCFLGTFPQQITLLSVFFVMFSDNVCPFCPLFEEMIWWSVGFCRFVLVLHHLFFDLYHLSRFVPSFDHYLSAKLANFSWNPALQARQRLFWRLDNDSALIRNQFSSVSLRASFTHGVQIGGTLANLFRAHNLLKFA